MMPVASVIPNVNARIRRSGVGRIKSGLSEGTSASSPLVRTTASNTPRAPPASDSTRLSVSNCRTS